MTAAADFATIREALGVGDIRVLDALDMPRTTGEIEKELRLRILNAWAEENGYGEIEWGDKACEPLFGRLLAHAWARNRGYYLSPQAVYYRLRKLEKLGLVRRLVMPSHSRSILWIKDAALSGEQP